MSAEATAWVFKNSPLTGAAFAIHLAIADSVNDQNDNEFWMKQEALAAKARVTRGTVQRELRAMVEMGLLEELDDDAERLRRKSHHLAKRVRFLMPDLTQERVDRASDDEDETAQIAHRDRADRASKPRESRIQGTQALTQSGTQALTPVVPIAADRFDEFWDSYPKRVGKGAARRSWDKAVKAGVPPQQIISAVEQYASWLAAGAHPDVDFCPPAANPATWLNQQRWLDELPVHRVRANRESRTRGAIVDVVTGGGSALTLKERMAALGREPQQAIGGPR